MPIIANLPHSGLQVPEHIAQHFTSEHLQSLPNSDWHLQELYRFLPSLGVTVMQANYSRYVVDLNRALKPPFLGSFWSAVVPEQTAFKQPIYTRKPSRSKVRDRIEHYYTPYHQKLTALLNEKITQFGYVYLLDLHSFMGLITDDVCLGNANGTTCGPHLIESAEAAFAQQGYQVVKNKVFTGGYITRHYGQQNTGGQQNTRQKTGGQRNTDLTSPRRREQQPVEALQIEIRYPTYLSNDEIERAAIPSWQGPLFEQAQSQLKRVFEALIASLGTQEAQTKSSD